MDSDMIDRNKHWLGVNQENVMVGVKHSRKDKETGMRDFLSAVRSKGSEYTKAVQHKKEYIQDYASIDGPESIGLSPMKGIIEAGKNLASVSGCISPFSTSNQLGVQSLVISNLENQKLLVPTSYNRELVVNLAFWVDNLAWLKENKVTIKMEFDTDESQAFNQDANLVGYQDYASTNELAKSLKYGKNEFDDMDTTSKNAIAQKMRNSRGRMSRLTRLVIAAMYHISMVQKGSLTEVDIEKRGEDEIVELSPTDLAALAIRDDMAYVFCDKPREPEYIAFLYIIAREFPYKQEFLMGRKENRNLFSKYCCVSIEEESNWIAVICNENPAYDGSNRRFYFSSDMWYSYMVNYARSIGCEAELDMAYSLASLMLSHELLPNITLPKRRSAAELFRRAAATKNTESQVPSRKIIKDLCLGAFNVAAGCFSIYKEIRSHDIISHERADVERSVLSQITRHKSVRNAWYRFLGTCGFGRVVPVISKIDFLNFTVEDPRCVKLDSVNVLPFFNLSPLDNSKVIKMGFFDLMSGCPYQTRIKLGTQIQENKSRTLALMRCLDLIEGQTKKARLNLKKPKYKNKECRNAESWLHPGDVVINKYGVRLRGNRFRKVLPTDLVEMVPPREFISNEDDVVWDDDDDPNAGNGDHETNDESDDDSSTKSFKLVRSDESEDNVELEAKGGKEVTPVAIEEEKVNDEGLSSNEEMTKTNLKIEQLLDERKIFEASELELGLMCQQLKNTGEYARVKKKMDNGDLEEGSFLDLTNGRYKMELDKNYKINAETMDIVNYMLGPRDIRSNSEIVNVLNSNNDLAKEIILNKVYRLNSYTGIKGRIVDLDPPRDFDGARNAVERIVKVEKTQPGPGESKIKSVVLGDRIIKEEETNVVSIGAAENRLVEDEVGNTDNTKLKQIDLKELGEVRKMRVGSVHAAKVKAAIIRKIFDRQNTETQKITTKLTQIAKKGSTDTGRPTRVNVTKELREAILERQDQIVMSGSAPRYDNAWLLAGVEVIKRHDHGVLGHQILRKDTLFRHWDRIPDEICSECMSVLMENLLQCTDRGNEFLMKTSRAAGVKPEILNSVLRSSVMRKYMFGGREFPGIGASNARIRADVLRDFSRSILALSGEKKIYWIEEDRKGGKKKKVCRQSLSMAEIEELDKWVRYTSKDCISDFSTRDLAAAQKEIRDVLRAY